MTDPRRDQQDDTETFDDNFQEEAQQLCREMRGNGWMQRSLPCDILLNLLR